MCFVNLGNTEPWEHRNESPSPEPLVLLKIQIGVTTEQRFASLLFFYMSFLKIDYFKGPKDKITYLEEETL